MNQGVPPLFGAAIVLSLAYAAVALVFLILHLTDKTARHFDRRLADLRGLAKADIVTDITKRHELSAVPWLDLILSRQQWVKSVTRVMNQADIQAPIGVFVLLSLVFALTGYALTALFSHNLAAAAGVALCLGFLPIMWIRRKKRKRMAAFERQLAEALELVARALKAGHTFSSGMNMVVSEFGDPIRQEFSKTLEEINFGANVLEALDNLMDRVDCPDLNFFVVSVKIQSETGGNLAEIVENIATLIRERFKLRGRIRILSAEGRVAAIVLTLLPFGVSVAIQFTNPAYLGLLFTHNIGRMLLYVVLGMMTLGIIVIRNMVRIEV